MFVGLAIPKLRALSASQSLIGSLFLGVIISGVVTVAIYGSRLDMGLTSGDIITSILLVGVGFTSTGVVESIAIGRIKFAVNPIIAITSSVTLLCVLAGIQVEVGQSFLKAIQADIGVSAFLAFNIFADGISLGETQWILGKGKNARWYTLLGLVALDFVLSWAIYLILPTILWPKIKEFGDAWHFQGEQPWLGLLFWTTFSTSFFFYLFVLAALLVRPLRGLAVAFGRIGRLFNLEKQPVRCLSVAMAAVVTVIFAGVGVWDVVSGFGAAAMATP